MVSGRDSGSLRLDVMCPSLLMKAGSAAKAAHHPCVDPVGVALIPPKRPSAARRTERFVGVGSESGTGTSATKGAGSGGGGRMVFIGLLVAIARLSNARPSFAVLADTDCDCQCDAHKGGEQKFRDG